MLGNGSNCCSYVNKKNGQSLFLSKDRVDRWNSKSLMVLHELTHVNAFLFLQIIYMAILLLILFLKVNKTWLVKVSRAYHVFLLVIRLLSFVSLIYLSY